MVVEHSDNVIDRALHLLQGEANAIAVGVGNLVHRAIRMYDTWSVYRDGSLHRHAILVAVDRDGVLDGFLGGPDNRLVSRCEGRIDELEVAELPMVIHVRAPRDWRTRLAE